MPPISGKAALIHAQPGCAIGDACVSVLLAEGVRVYATHQADAAKSFDQLSDSGWAALMQRCLAELDGLDIFICCAPRERGTSITNTSLEQFRDLLYRSALAGWLGQKHAIVAMREHSPRGAILHITSVLARAAADHAAAQCSAEAGILMSSKAAALECAKAEDGIVVNTILAGPIEEDGTDRLQQGATPVQAADVAAAALFMVSDGASYMTGTELAVDAGWLSR